MNALHRGFDQPTRDLFAEFADPCTIIRDGAGPVPTRCIVEDGAEQLGEYGQVIGRVTKASFIKIEWTPKRGDVVAFEDGCQKTCETLVDDDGLVAEWILNA
jgi:hypothetical protein